MVFQILSVTCDNASNNDTMVEHLSTLVENFPGAANQTRCFNHILNLVAKSILRQFEVKKKAGNLNADSEDLDEATRALAVLTQELELDNGPIELPELADDKDEGKEDDEVTEDDKDGLHHERDNMSDDEVAELEECLVPIRLTLSKVSPFKLSPKQSEDNTLQLRALANAIKNSSTIVLPQWFAKLEELDLKVRMMPRDVPTRWNSTFDMLDFAIDYRAAIDTITSNRELNLRKYELDDDEWVIAENLRDTLKVCFS